MTRTRARSPTPALRRGPAPSRARRAPIARSEVAASNAGLISGMFDAGTDNEHAVRGRFKRFGIGNHLDELGHRSVFVVGKRPALNVKDRPVRGVDHRQGRRIGLDKEQRGARVADCVTDGLSQRGRGHKCRNQHDVLDLVGDQSVAQQRGFCVIGARHPARQQPIAALGSAFPGAQDGRDHLTGHGRRRPVTANVKVVLVDNDSVGAFPFDQHHT